MSNYRKLEVSLINDTDVRLSYWDSEHGRDILLFNQNGQWYQGVWEGYGDDAKSVPVPVDLVTILRTIAKGELP